MLTKEKKNQAHTKRASQEVKERNKCRNRVKKSREESGSQTAPIDRITGKILVQKATRCSFSLWPTLMFRFSWRYSLLVVKAGH